MSKVKIGFGLILLVALAATVLGQNYSASPNAPISNAAATTSTIDVPAGTTITDVQVAVSINHSHGGDLKIELSHEPTEGLPQTITLLNGLNLGSYLYGCGADAINATFSDAAGAAMDGFDCADDFDKAVGGAWRPTNALSTFDGRDAGGTWTLTVTDRLPSDDGTLQSWGLVLNATSAAPLPGPGGGGLPIIGGQVASLCSDFDGSTNTTVRAVFPAGSDDLYCRIIAEDTNFVTDAGEVGDQGVINKGVIQAVDVYSITGAGNPAGAQVCLEGSGSLIFMDSANAPRIPVWVPGYVRGDYTCARVSATGTMVLVEEGPDGTVVTAAEDLADDVTSSSTSDDLIGASFADTVWTGTPLEGCEITTGDILNLRTRPGLDGRVITQVPFGLSLEALAVEGDRYRVIYLDGQGWLNKEYLNLGAACE